MIYSIENSDPANWCLHAVRPRASADWIPLGFKVIITWAHSYRFAAGKGPSNHLQTNWRKYFGPKVHDKASETALKPHLVTSFLRANLLLLSFVADLKNQTQPGSSRTLPGCWKWARDMWVVAKLPSFKLFVALQLRMKLVILYVWQF